MAELAALALKINSDEAKQAVVILKNDFPQAATAAEKAAKKWSQATDEASKSSDDFSRRVKNTIKDLEFERTQLARSTTERQKYAAIRRAGVSEASAEGQAIAASVKALQAQKSAIEATSVSKAGLTRVTQTFSAQWRIMIAAMIGAAGIGAISRASDAFVTLTNSIKVTGATSSDVAAIQDRLFASANKNGVEIGALGTLYSRTALAGKELGISQETLLQFTEGVTAALKVQGGSAAQSSGALLQLSQALGSGIVRAEEFNSILEGALPIAQAAARGMDGMGGSVAKLRTAILAGTVTSKAFFDATMKGFEETKKQAASASMTMGQSMTALENSFINLVGQFDKVTGASKNSAGFIANISRAMDQAAKDVQDPDSFMGVMASTFEKGSNLIRNNVIAIGIVFTKVGQLAVEGLKLATSAFDDFNVWAAGVSAGFLAAFAGIPDALGQVFTNAWEIAKSKTAAGINSITAWLNQNVPDALSWLRPNATDFDTTTKGTGQAGAGMGASIEAAAQRARQEMADRIERQSIINRQAGMQSDENRARIGGLTAVGPIGLGGGTGTAVASKAAQDAAKKYAELTAELELTKAAQDKMTDAARKGGVAFQEQEALLQAQQKALDIFGKKLDETDPRLTKLRDLMLSIAQGKIAEAFATSTKDLENQNVILEAEIRLMNERPEIIAKEIALIKVKQEAEKAGTAITQADVDARRQAIEANETLKSQAEELKRAQELWTAPLKSALESIQSTAADAFEEMLNTGKINFESLGDIFKKTITRMIAEFMALATVRPVMNVLVNAVSGTGVGGGGTQSGNVMGSIFGSGGGSGGLGSMGGIGDFFGKTLYGGTEIQGPLQPGAASLGSTGGVSVGGAIGGGMGIASGAMGLMKGGGSTVSTISNIGMMVGGIVSMIPGIGTIAGPLIMLASSLLPMLFGGTPEPPTLRGIGSLDFQGGKFRNDQAAYGEGAQGIDLSELSAPIKSLLTAAKVKLSGVTGDYGIQQQSLEKGDFKNQTTFIKQPDGTLKQWSQSSDPEQQKKGMDTAMANMTHAMMLDIGSGVSDIMRQGLLSFGNQNLEHAFSMEELQTAVNELNSYDEAIKGLGKTMNEAESALQQIDDAFKGLYETAEKYGLDTGVLDTAKAAERLKVGQDFAQNIARQLMDPLTGALFDIGEERTNLIRNNSALMGVVGYDDQTANIEQLYLVKRNKIIEDYNAAALEEARQNAEAQLQVQKDLTTGIANTVRTIQNLIDELSPGGALSNLDPSGQLAGLRASYTASYAEAIADPTNNALIEKAVQDARAFLQFDKTYTGGTSAYNADLQEVMARLQALQTSGIEATTTKVTDIDLKNILTQLLAATQQSTSNSAERSAELDKVIGLLERYLANGPDTTAT